MVTKRKKGARPPRQQLAVDFVLPVLENTDAHAGNNKAGEIAEAKRQFERQAGSIVIWSCGDELFKHLGLTVSEISKLADDFRFLMLRLPARKQKLLAGRGSLTITDCTGSIKAKNVRLALLRHPEKALQCCIKHIDWDGHVTILHQCSAHQHNPAVDDLSRLPIGHKCGKITVMGYSPKPVGPINPQVERGEYRYSTSYEDLATLLQTKPWGVQFTFGMRCTCVYTLHPDKTAPGGGVAFRSIHDDLCHFCNGRGRSYD